MTVIRYIFSSQILVIIATIDMTIVYRKQNLMSVPSVSGLGYPGHVLSAGSRAS